MMTDFIAIHNGDSDATVESPAGNFRAGIRICDDAPSLGCCCVPLTPCGRVKIDGLTEAECTGLGGVFSSLIPCAQAAGCGSDCEDWCDSNGLAPPFMRVECSSLWTPGQICYRSQLPAGGTQLDFTGMGFGTGGGGILIPRGPFVGGAWRYSHATAPCGQTNYSRVSIGVTCVAGGANVSCNVLGCPVASFGVGCSLPSPPFQPTTPSTVLMLAKSALAVHGEHLSLVDDRSFTGGAPPQQTTVGHTQVTIFPIW